MAQATLNQILEQLKSLEPSELRYLSQAIQSQLGRQEPMTKQATFHQALLDSGLVQQLKPVKHKTSRQFRPVSVKDEPVSQTLLKERQ
jgi:hypothetical protein